MAALLVGMSVMAVLMSALLPVWSHMAKREREEELVFRGNQYARAIGLFQRKYANTAPPTIDVLVEQRFLRKKFKDPITGEDFQPVYANQNPQLQGQGGSQVAQRPGQQATTTVQASPQLQMGFNSTGAGAQGGIIGVMSKSKDSSIKLYKGRSHYNEWPFIFVQQVQRPGQTVNLQNLPGQGGPGGGRGGPGQGQQQMPFGMQPGNMPGMGGRGGQQFPQPPPGFGVPNRPPVGAPGQFPGGFPQTPGAGGPSGMVQPVVPGQPRRPGQ